MTDTNIIDTTATTNKNNNNVASSSSSSSSSSRPQPQFNAHSIISNWEAKKRMCESTKEYLDGDNPRHYWIDPNTNKRHYHTKEAEILAEIKTASARPFRHDGYDHDKLTRENNPTASSNNNNLYYTNSNSVKDMDLPFAFKLATRGMNTQLKQAPTSNFSEDPASMNYSADYQTAQMIANSLKQNELSSGQEYSTSDLEKLIRGRFQGVNDNIVKLAVDLIVNDAENLKARVAGTFPHIEMRISARNPLQQQQQQQQNQNPSTNGNFRANDSFPQNIQDQINQLSDNDKQLLQNVAQSVVIDILSQNQGLINESDLEDTIVQRYNVSADMADLVVEILKVVNNGTYSKQIILDTSNDNSNNNNGIVSQTAAFPNQKQQQNIPINREKHLRSEHPFDAMSTVGLKHLINTAFSGPNVIKFKK